MHNIRTGINLKNASANIMLVANAFVWYLLAFIIIKSLSSQLNVPVDDLLYYELLVLGVNAGAIALSALLSSLIVGRLKNRITFLYAWLAVGIILSLLPVGLNGADINSLLAISLVFGAYFGIGMPITMGYYTVSIGIKNRGKISGITFLVIGMLSSIFAFIVIGNVVIACLVLAIIRLSGLVVFHLLRERKIKQEISKEVSYKSIVSNKSFLLYFIPWCIFSIVNYTTIPIISNKIATEQLIWLSTVLESIVIAIVAVITGFLIDIVGRKRLTIIGFAMLGIGYAALGISNLEFATIFYIFADGVAWGIFYVVFLLTIWGDLAHSRNSEKYYFLGAMPYLLSSFMRPLLQTYLSGMVGTVFSYASVFLFLAVLPLIYAPETLSEKIMKKRDLDSYVKEAMKRVQKESEKNGGEGTKSLQVCNVAKAQSEERSEYEEACKLAEKYY